MSRAKIVRINKEKIKERLKEIHHTQNWLSKQLYPYITNPHSLYNAINQEKISENLAVMIGSILDLAPEYLADETPDSLFPDAPHNFALHLYQDNNAVHPMAAIEKLLTWKLCSVDDFEWDDLKDFIDEIDKITDEFCTSKRQKKA